MSALRAALGYAARGWPVFPCRAGGKAPLTPHGFKDATTDAAVIRRWWRHFPRANVAVATGAPGPDVLDVDVRPGGDGRDALDLLSRAGLLPGPGTVVATPSGGLHLYFQGSEQRGGSLRGHYVDLKARGGYVVAPPSQVGGRTYELDVLGPQRTGPLDWQACRDLLAPPPRVPHPRDGTRPRHPDGLVRTVAAAREGHRNTTLYWAACRAVDERHPPEVLEALEAAAVTAGLSRTEARRTIHSALRRATDRLPA